MPLRWVTARASSVAYLRPELLIVAFFFLFGTLTLRGPAGEPENPWKDLRQPAWSSSTPDIGAHLIALRVRRRG